MSFIASYYACPNNCAYLSKKGIHFSISFRLLRYPNNMDLTF